MRHGRWERAQGYEKFTKQQIDSANDYIFGRLTIEGAPHIKESDLAVFDCANK